MNGKKRSVIDGRDTEHDPKRSASESKPGTAALGKQKSTEREDEKSQSRDPGGEGNEKVVNTDEQRHATNRDKIRSSGPANEGTKK